MRSLGGLVPIEAEGFSPFFAAVKHRDVFAVETNPAQFKNAPFPILVSGAERSGGSPPTKNLVGMDDAEHAAYRSIIADWFAPKALNRRRDEIREMARRYVKEFVDGPREIDFINAVGVSLPLRFLASTLGLPREDDEQLHDWTRQFFGAQDPDLAGSEGDYQENMSRVIGQFSEYFLTKTSEWREKPDGSLGSVIANAQIRDDYMQPDLLCAYFILLAAAGHDTVATVLAGGVEALARHPDEFDKLKADLTLTGNAVEEIIRWVTPTKHFMRTACVDTSINGQAVSAGDWILLSYPSANRDEEVFEDPFVFDIGRKDARKHLAFGAGPHFCIGNQLARLQLRAFFEELACSLEGMEIAGPVEYSATTFVSTFKRLPLRLYSSA
ncbi:MAG: cytochrome P450 [Pseudomonadota bacterium]